MFTRLKSVMHLAVAVAIAMPATAQNAQTNGRWQAWIGCWRPAVSLIRVIGNTASSVVCVVPSTTASSVDIVTISDGKVVDRTHVDTDGQPHAISKEGCTGWQSAKWSASSAQRVYLKSEFNCSGAPATHVTALYAMAGAGEWIDVQGMRVDSNSGVHAVRYREVGIPGSLPAEVSQKLQGHALAKRAAMLAATARPSLADVAEASREIDASVVSTWLIEIDKVTIERPKPLNAKQLTQLADNGVPPSVIDVMVGLSYPDVLTVNPVSRGVARQNADSAYAQYGPIAAISADPIIAFDRFGYPIYAAETSALACSPFSYSPYYSSWDLYSSQLNCAAYGYGFSGYPGYGYGFGAYPYGAYGVYGGYFGGGYFGGGPIVVPRGPGGPTGTGAPATHGRVINGKGYSAGGTGSGTTATPTTGAAGTTTSAAASPPPPPRTAEPRKP